MRVDEWLQQAQQKLDQAGIGTARLDALVLLEDTLHADRAHLLAHPEIQLTSEQEHELSQRIQSRAKHEPLAYIRGKTEFYGRNFMVNKHVLEPRPESETMIDLLKNTIEQLQGKQLHQVLVADIGTGSGALAITAKLELPNIRAIGIDIDPKCLEVASYNMQQLNADIILQQGDLLKPLEDRADQNRNTTLILLCNLPYVPDGFHINPAAMQEPRIAIFGGLDGLDVYRRLFNQIQSNSTMRPQYILTEALPPQHESLTDIAKQAAYKQVAASDFIQLFKTNLGMLASAV